MPEGVPAAHASSLLTLPPGAPYALLAFWFAGAKESAADVGIALSGFERATQQWTPARWVVDRQSLGRQLGFAVRRLGNPVAWLDGDGRVQLFVVATGLGGWAASRIVQLRQAPGDAVLATLRFDVVRVLPLSWLFNTSFLVRNTPLPLSDGGMVLPVHFELGRKWPAALRFDAQGRLLTQTRLTTRAHLLQPTLLAVQAPHWLALLRDQRPDGRIAAVQSTDGGVSWHDLPDLALTNPDAAVAALAGAPGQYWLAHNSSAHARNVLDLSASGDGVQWSLLQGLAQGTGTQEFSYPALAWADGALWVSYTEQRRRIAWQRFERAP